MLAFCSNFEKTCRYIVIFYLYLTSFKIQGCVYNARGYRHHSVGYLHYFRCQISICQSSIKSDRFMFSTVFPTLHDVTIGENYEAAMVDTLGFISGFTEITAEAFRPTIEAILLSDYVIHVGSGSRRPPLINVFGDHCAKLTGRTHEIAIHNGENDQFFLKRLLKFFTAMW